MVKKKSSKVKVALRPAAKKNAKPTKPEMTRLGQALRTLGGLGGTALGSMVGYGTTGGNFGSGLGAALSKWLGSGDYTVSANSITQKATAGMIPAMHKEGQTIVVRHREFLTEIRGATSFTIRNEFDLNPGLQTTFPWLSGIASQYSQYKIRGLVYHYVPTSGNAVSSTNAALGTVMLQTSYRASEAAPTSKVEMLNEYWSSEAKPSEEFCHPIECDPRENPFNIQYVRSGTLPSTENQLMYDLGRTTVAVSGQQANEIVLGDLWVTYEIELKKPVVKNLTNEDVSSFAATSISNINTSNPFGTDMVTRFDSFPGGITISPTSVDFGRGNVGCFCVAVYYQGATALTGGTLGVTGGSVVPSVAGANVIVSGASGGTGIITFTITMPNPDIPCIATLSLASLVGVTRCRIVVTEINPDLRVNT